MKGADLDVEYLIRACAFRVGQRVKLSRYGIAHGIKFKHGVTKGTVKKVDATFGLDVLVDGYKQSRGFLAGFWEPVNGWWEKGGSNAKTT